MQHSGSTIYGAPHEESNCLFEPSRTRFNGGWLCDAARILPIDYYRYTRLYTGAEPDREPREN
jgi:hypothetical protein